MPGGDRFSHARGLHYQGTGDTLRSVLHRYRQPRREDRGYHSPSRQPVDDADRAESRRPERRLPSWQSLCDTLPVYEILGRIAQRSRPRRHSSRSLAGTIAQFECFRRAVRAFNKRGVFKPDDLLRTGIASARAPAVHGALSYRAQSSGPGKPNIAANVRRCPTPSPCSTPTAPRRNAQLLPSGRSLTNVDSFFGQFARAIRIGPPCMRLLGIVRTGDQSVPAFTGGPKSTGAAGFGTVRVSGTRPAMLRRTWPPGQALRGDAGRCRRLKLARQHRHRADAEGPEPLGTAPRRRRPAVCWNGRA